MKKFLASISASLLTNIAHSLYKKARPSTDTPTKGPSLQRIIFYALLCIGAVSLVVAGLIVFGFPQISWAWTLSLAAVTAFLAMTWFFFSSLRKEVKRVDAGANHIRSAAPAITSPPTEEPRPHVEVQETTMLSEEQGEGKVPAHAEHVEIIRPATMTEERDEAADETVDDSIPASPTEPRHSAHTEETGSRWLASGILKNAPWGIAAAALIVAFGIWSWYSPDTETPKEKAREEMENTSPSPFDTAQRSTRRVIALNVDDEVTVKTSKECSATYRPQPNKVIRIVGMNAERHYLLETQSGKYEMGPGLPPVPGVIASVRVCSIDDDPVEVWITVEEPSISAKEEVGSYKEPPPLPDTIPDGPAPTARSSN